MNMSLTTKMKKAAREMGADLVGVGNIERWSNCPIKMSPAGLLPSAANVLVCGIHHIDGMVEIGAESSPHDLGPYFYQFYMNAQLDHISYRMACLLEDQGYQALPITASNIWRYRPYKELPATFSPDMSNIYSPVAAGLAEMGENGLALTPEYGARNRFVSIVTNAPLQADPLMPGNTVCDHCGLCRTKCPMQAFTKEVVGETSLDIEDKRYPFLEKNLWRCAWAEHFGVSVDVPVPEQVTEESIINAVSEHGVRGGTLGYCLKYCLPKNKRKWERSYSSAPRRKQDVQPLADALSVAKQKALLQDVMVRGAQWVRVLSREEAEALGVDAWAMLPDAKSFVVAAREAAKSTAEDLQAGYAPLYAQADQMVQDGIFRLGRALEDMGFSCAPYEYWQVPEEKFHSVTDAGMEGRSYVSGILATSAVLEAAELSALNQRGAAPVALTRGCKQRALEYGAHLVGVSSVERMDALSPEIKRHFEGDVVLDAEDKSPRWLPSEGGVVTERLRTVRGPADFLKTARSVVVVGVRMAQASVDRCMEPPAEAIGPMSFQEAQVHRELQEVALQLKDDLASWGYQAVAVQDLMGTGSELANPRGPQPNMFCHRFAALCAGLGTIGGGGFLLTPEYGPNVRFMALVTDAPLEADVLRDLSGLRQLCDGGCTECVSTCTVCAHTSVVEIPFNGQTLCFNKIDQRRCDWSLRFALTPEEGLRFTGSKSYAKAPDHISVEALAEGMRGLDPILKVRPCVAEQCMLACPLSRQPNRKAIPA